MALELYEIYEVDIGTSKSFLLFNTAFLRPHDLCYHITCGQEKIMILKYCQDNIYIILWLYDNKTYIVNLTNHLDYIRKLT